MIIETKAEIKCKMVKKVKLVIIKIFLAFRRPHFGTNELAHLEMVGSLVHQLTEGASIEEIQKAGLAPYYTDHGVGVYPQAAAGFPFTASVLQVKGDPVADLTEDLAAEQKARATYEKLIDLCKDEPDVVEVLRFLRQREVVHFQRFGEALNGVQEKLAQKKFYMKNQKEIEQVLENQDDNDCGCHREEE